MKELRLRRQRNIINTHSKFLPARLRLEIAPFSEEDILHLHKAFLTPGVHYFHVLHVEAGRSFMQQLLCSLHCYKNIGYLAATTGMEQKTCRDILQELQEHGFLYEPYFLDEFFIDNFDYDFMWVEATDQLFTLPWYEEFHGKLNEYNISMRIPVIVLSYEQG